MDAASLEGLSKKSVGITDGYTQMDALGIPRVEYCLWLPQAPAECGVPLFMLSYIPKTWVH